MVNFAHSSSPELLRQGVALGKELTAEQARRAVVELNSGTIPARANSPARIPKSDWHSPTPVEMRILSDASANSDVSRIEIIPPNSEVLSLSAAAFDRVTWSDSDKDLAAAVDGPSYTRLVAAMLQSARRLGKVLGDPLVRISAPDLTTVTMGQGMFIGLHVDEWFQGRHAPRGSRPNRMVFNLGREPRYFLFINIPVEAMMDHTPGPSGNHGTTIGQRFMESHPDYPVCRIRILPGEAYIAPTENLVHDASSAGTTQVDIAGHLLGQFTFAAMPESSSARGQ